MKKIIVISTTLLGLTGCAI
ncbi:lipoprotein, partial [Acinetobacter baumannii]